MMGREGWGGGVEAGDGLVELELRLAFDKLSVCTSKVDRESDRCLFEMNAALEFAT